MKPRVLILYYSFSNQTQRVATVMQEAFQQRDWDADVCQIEFIDPRYRIEFPFRPVGRKLLRWLWPQLRGKTGDVRVSGDVLARDYDLICLGSPTWWLNPAMPVVSFLRSPAAGQLLHGKRFAVFAVCRKAWWNNLRQVKKLACRQGGTFVAGTAFCFAGGEIQSMLSFISYMQYDTDRDRCCGVRIRPFGVGDAGLAHAREFVGELADTIAPFTPPPHQDATH